MKKFATIFFVTLGVIFSIIILCVLYLFIFDPFHIKPFLFGKSTTRTSQNMKADSTDSATTTTTKTTGKAFLSEGQRQTLASFGIDPNSLPSSITVAQEECFKSKLGEARFAEIVAGASPTAIEFFSAKSCI